VANLIAVVTQTFLPFSLHSQYAPSVTQTFLPFSLH
jgi:hypothetical protein